jgi:hypothetical protein
VKRQSSVSCLGFCDQEGDDGSDPGHGRKYRWQCRRLWLKRFGFDVTVVERAPAFRDGGQNVDVCGSRREVLRRMGLERAALDAGTGEEGIAWVDEHGRMAAKVVAEPGTDGPTAEMEVLRGDLARLLYEPASRHCIYRFELDWNTERQRAYLHERFADAGWQTPRVLTGMGCDDGLLFRRPTAGSDAALVEGMRGSWWATRPGASHRWAAPVPHSR